MEHLSAKDEILTLAGVSPGSGVLHEGFLDGPSGSYIDIDAFREELRAQ